LPLIAPQELLFLGNIWVASFAKSEIASRGSRKALINMAINCYARGGRGYDPLGVNEVLSR
jgi:hypothetical protein